MRAISAITLAATCFTSLPALAQERDTVPLSPIVVTATRSPAPTNTVSNSVTVLEGADLERAGIATVGDAIRSLAGVAITQSGSFGGVTSLFLRGGQSDYVRVLVDGVPLNASGGALDLANVSTLNVERIELVRGPGSVLYGSDAVSGVLQIFTRAAAGTKAEVSVRGGAYASSDVAADFAAGSRTSGGSLAFGQRATDGLYDFNNRYRNSTLSAGLHLAPDAHTDLTLAARFGESLLHYPTDGSGAQVDSNAYTTSQATTLSLDAGRFLRPGLEGRLLLGYHHELNRIEDAQDNSADTTGLYDFHSRTVNERTSADARLNAHIGAASVLTAGGSIEEEHSANSSTSNFGPGGYPSLYRTNGAAYLQLVSEWRDRAWLQAGARLDDNQRFGSFGTWRLGLTALVAPLTRVRANLGTAFREPAFSENYSTAFTVGNQNLRPERSRSWELGLEREFPRAGASVAVTYFDQQFRDIIQYTFAPPLPDSANYFNIAGANASGVEVEARFAPSTAVRLEAQYTFLHTSVSDSGYDGAQFKPGSPLIRRPAHTATLSAELTPLPGIAGGARIAYTGAREDLDFSQFPSPRVVLAAYTRVDLWADVALLRLAPGRPSLALTARLDNAFDAKYTEIYGFRTPGRMLRVGMRLDVAR